MDPLDGSSGGGKAKAGSFQSMNLSKDILSGINRLGYKQPTPVQRKALPVALAGMDIVVMSRTGSGKTCVFLVPLLQKILSHDGKKGVRGIILSPTRELAMQTYKFAKDMAKFTDIRIAPIIGGDGIEAQFDMLAEHPDIIVATPGRLMHHLREISTFKLKDVQMLVFDEADRLFEMGFAEQLNEIIRECPANRQTLLFSATMPKMLMQFTRAGLRDPQLIRLETDNKLSEELRLAFFSVRSNEKVSALLYLVRRVIPADHLTIIFTATRHHSEFLYHLLLKIGVTATLVYGNMDQESRTENLRLFRTGAVSYLIVTDLAARGIDVPLLNNVVNFHFPPTPKLFVHRCGRAARQGRIGFAFSLVDPEELAYSMDVHLFLDKKMSNPATFSPETDPQDIPEGAIEPYTLSSMNPQMVHFGLLPQDPLDQESEFVKREINEDSYFYNAWRVCENAMKQFRRTRNEATRGGVKMARDIAKKNGIARIHPLIMGCDPKNCSSAVIDKANFVKHLQTFRPSQTVFETGIGFGTGSQAAKNVGKKGTKEMHGVEVMKALRREVYSSLDRNKSKVAAAMAAAADHLNASNGVASNEIKDGHADDDSHSANHEDDEDLFPETDEFDLEVSDNEEGGEEEGQAKDNTVRVSRAARKKMKKHGVLPTPSAAAASSGDSGLEVEGSGHVDGAGDKFRDSKFYMSYGTENVQSSYVEAALQPQSALRSTESMNAQMMESAIMDVAPDEAIEMNKKKRMLRWDAKKRKFVKQTLQEMSEGGRGAKRVRTEAGVVLSKSARPAGEMYEKWKKKTRKEVDSSALEDDDAYARRPKPNVRVNSTVKEELRSAQDIKKGRKEQAKLKLKNMSRDKRNSILKEQKKAKKAKQNNVRLGTQAGNRKMKVIMRV